MTLLRCKTLSRLILPLAAVLFSGLSVASTLPRPVPEQPSGLTTDATPSTLLPKMMDTSTSYADTGNTAPDAAAAPVAVEHARMASDELSGGPIDRCKPPEPQASAPEPMSIILMTSGLLGLIGARCLRKCTVRLDRTPGRSLR